MDRIVFYVVQKIAVEPNDVSRFLFNAEKNGFLRIYSAATGEVMWKKDEPTT